MIFSYNFSNYLDDWPASSLMGLFEPSVITYRCMYSDILTNRAIDIMQAANNPRGQGRRGHQAQPQVVTPQPQIQP